MINKIVTFFFVFLFLFSGQTFSSEVKTSDRFFRVGDGTLTIKNLASGRQATVTYLTEKGELIESAFSKIDSVFGYPTSEKKENISRRLVGFLDYFSDKFGKDDKTIYLRSGYRSPRYNQALRDKGRTAAKTSTHIDGMAIDFYLKGVDGKMMWESIRHMECCGVGHYGGATIHLDSGRPRFWEQATAQVKTDHSDYNRQIYYSTEYDKYQQGEVVRSFFTSVSDFGFGVKQDVVLVPEGASGEKNSKKEFKAKIISESGGKCLPVNQREDARFIRFEIPKKIKSGRYQIKIEFCDLPFAEMPKERLSNVIEVKE